MLAVIGAGLPRTGTRSLKAALERLLDGRCYHMHEVFEHPDHVPFWRAALRGEAVDWSDVLGDYDAAVDWPASAFWRQLAEAYPSAVVVLSVRDSARTWWQSVDSTILPVGRRQPDPEHDDLDWHAMFHELLLPLGLTPNWDDADAAMAAYERHNVAVRAGVPAERLVEWRAEDGWEPLCVALGLPIPDEPFPRMNTREEWAERRTEQTVVVNS